MRCSELTAFGLANRTRRSASSRITPSPTRGASSNSSSSWRNGKLPSAIIRAKRSNDREVVVLELAEAGDRGSDARLPGDHGHDDPAVAHRDALHVDPLGRAEDGRRRPRRSRRCARPGPRAAAPISSTTEPTRSVGYSGLAGGGPHLGQHHRTAAVLPVDRREEEQVGEAQVGEGLPRRREPLHVTQRLSPQRGLRARLLEERGHGAIA